MQIKRLFLAASGSTLLIGAAALGTAGIQSASADAPSPVNADNIQGVLCPALVNPAPGTMQNPFTCQAISIPGGVPIQNAAPTTWYSSAVAVNETTFLALAAQDLGVSPAGLTAAFQQAETIAAAQPQWAVTQDLLLSLVAQQLGVSQTTLTAALQQAAATEVNVLFETGQISLAQVPAYDSAIAYGQFGLGLGFGIPGFSAPAV